MMKLIKKKNELILLINLKFDIRKELYEKIIPCGGKIMFK